MTFRFELNRDEDELGCQSPIQNREDDENQQQIMQAVVEKKSLAFSLSWHPELHTSA